MPIKRRFTRQLVDSNDDAIGEPANPQSVTGTVSVTAAGVLPVADTSIGIVRHGYMSSLDNALGSSTKWNSVWASGNDYTGHDVAVGLLRVVSSDAADVDLPIDIDGLDNNWVQVNEVITTDGADGTTPVDGATPMRRLNRARIKFAAINVGTITITKKIGGEVMAVIPALTGKDNGAFYTVPLGYNCYFKRLWFLQGGGSSYATVGLFADTDGVSRAIWVGFAEDGVALDWDFGKNVLDLSDSGDEFASAGDEIDVRAILGAAGPARCTARLEMLLVPA